MSHNSQKTVHHANIELFRGFNTPFETEEGSTLNEFFALHAAESIPAPAGIFEKYPFTQYLGLGNFPLRDGLPEQHRCTDARLFRHIPWLVIKQADETPDIQNKYKMRVPVTIDTDDYYFYYLKKFDPSAIKPSMKKIVVSNGIVASSTAITLVDTDVAAQNPIPVAIDNDVVREVNGEHITVQSIITIEISQDEADAIVDAISYMPDGERLIAITEIAVVSAYEKTFSGYSDVHHAQVTHFIGTHIPLTGTVTEINLSYVLSSMMPFPPVET